MKEEQKKMFKKHKNYFILGIAGIFLIVMGLVMLMLLPNVIFGEKKDNTNKVKEEQKEKIIPLLYEVTKEGNQNKIYILGSIHVGELNKVELPKYLVDAYENSEYLAFELGDIPEIDPTLFLLKGDDVISNHLSKDTIDKLSKFFTDQGQVGLFNEKLSPGAFNQLIAQAVFTKAGYTGTDGVDQFFLNKAKKDNKKIIAIEELSTQLDLLLNASSRYYELSINNAIENFDDDVEDLKKLYSSWKDGTIKEELRKEMNDKEFYNTLSDADKKLVDDYEKKMITDRDLFMTNKMEEFLNNDYKMLYIVGATHVVGENGIVDQLIAKGYTVKEVK